MRPTLIGVLTGWLLSTWMQVPPPLQSGLKTAARWIKAIVIEKLREPDEGQKNQLQAKASKKSSTNTE